MELKPGITLGNFEILALLGQGGMGEVWRAKDLSLGRDVALKVPLRSVGESEISRKRFEREARVLAQLNHPNIASVYGFDEEDDILFLIMELVPGPTLGDRIRAGDLKLPEIFTIFGQIAAALEYGHEKGVIHRDIKPGNIKIGPGNRVRILDYGLARALALPDITAYDEDSLHEASTELTRAGVVLGSPPYMSPEQTHAEKVDTRADIWAMGCVLYEVLTGQRPFRGDDRDALFDAIRNREPNYNLISHETPGAVVELLQRCLRKNPWDRLRDIGEARILFTGLQSNAFPDTGRTVELLGGSGDVGFRTVLFAQISDISELKPKLGVSLSSDIVRHHDEVFRACARKFGGRQKHLSGDSLCAFFELSSDAIRCAIAYLKELADFDSPAPIAASIGLHAGEFTPRGGADSEGSESGASAHIVDTSLRLMSLAGPNQILLTSLAFDAARQMSSPDAKDRIEWLAHGLYELAGEEQPVEISEVGVRGLCLLKPPPDSAAARRILMPGEQEILGWRPSKGHAVPTRENWKLVRQIGKGGFGEVWLAEHRKMKSQRVFKFCFEPERLRALKREVVLFRLMKVALGDRDDIAQIIDWEFERPPFFIESEYSSGGSLPQWAQRQGGIKEVDAEIRFELLAQIADALTAAHSVGVLHKDIKPANILISTDPQSGIHRAILSDFGIGMLADRQALRANDVTIPQSTLGLTRGDTMMGSGLGSGTRLYMAPELIEKKPPTTYSDIYALGVTLYQLAVGDFERALAPGWERDIDDELLKEDIAACVQRLPERRLSSAAKLAELLRTRQERREALHAAREAEQQARRAKSRRVILSVVSVVALTIAVGLGLVASREKGLRDLAETETARAEIEATRATSVRDFLVELFEAANPQSGSPGSDMTALELLDLGTQRALERMESDRELAAVLLYTIGVTYHGVGQKDKSLELMNYAVEVFEEDPQSYGNMYVDAMDTIVDVLASKSSSSEDTQNAMTVFMAVAHEIEATYPLALARAERAQAYLLIRQLKYSEALPFAQSAERRAAAVHGENSLMMVFYSTIVGRALRHLRRYDEAEIVLVKCLETLKRELGERHPRVGQVYFESAMLYKFASQRDKARSNLLESLSIRRETLGDLHPTTQLTFQRYLEICDSSDQHEAVLEELVGVIERTEAELGPDAGELIPLLQLERRALRGMGRSNEMRRIEARIEKIEASIPRGLPDGGASPWHDPLGEIPVQGPLETIP